MNSIENSQILIKYGFITILKDFINYIVSFCPSFSSSGKLIFTTITNYFSLIDKDKKASSAKVSVSMSTDNIYQTNDINAKRMSQRALVLQGGVALGAYEGLE